ncbi:hypothetical protein, partial [Escherichia coli]|uniref:hypothetical protein n=1 Tax=Escherichia coli TaxID=562 RepID=UPI0019544BFB
MLAVTEDPKAATATWLAELEHALAKADARSLEDLFHADSHWRDILAFIWDMQTVSGREAIIEALTAHAGKAAATHFTLPP